MLVAEKKNRSLYFLRDYVKRVTDQSAKKMPDHNIIHWDWDLQHEAIPVRSRHARGELDKSLSRNVAQTNGRFVFDKIRFCNRHLIFLLTRGQLSAVYFLWYCLLRSIMRDSFTPRRHKLFLTMITRQKSFFVSYESE